MDGVISQLVAGVSIGSVLLFVALGLALTFGQMGVINMAHGEFIMAGAYTAWIMQNILGDAGLSLIVSIPVAFLVGGLLGVILEEVLLRRMYHRPLDTLLATFGVSLILQQAARSIFGAPNKEVRSPEWLAGSIELLGANIPVKRIFILVLLVIVVAALASLLTYTSLGRRIRAVVLNRDLAEATGISTRAIDRLTFFIGSGLAGIAGVALTLVGSTGPTLGTNYIVDAFLVVVIGGIGQIRGAILAAFALGIAQAFIEMGTTATWARFIVLILIVLFLQWKPQGMFVVRTRSLA